MLGILRAEGDMLGRGHLRRGVCHGCMLGVPTPTKALVLAAISAVVSVCVLPQCGSVSPESLQVNAGRGIRLRYTPANTGTWRCVMLKRCTNGCPSTRDCAAQRACCITPTSRGSGVAPVNATHPSVAVVVPRVTYIVGPFICGQCPFPSEHCRWVWETAYWSSSPCCSPSTIWPATRRNRFCTSLHSWFVSFPPPQACRVRGCG